MENNNEEENGKLNEISLVNENGEKYSFFKYDGIVLPLEYTTSEADFLKRFSYVEDFPYEAGDVLLCTYPKTGSHWVTSILHYLTSDGRLDDLVSYPPCYIDLYDYEGEIQREGRRLLLSHFPPKHLPIEHFSNGGKTILLFRNPKDTVVSMYHMMKTQKVIGDFKISWDSFVKYWLEGKVPLGSYFEYYNSWQKELNEKPDKDVLIVQYENLKMNTLKDVRRIQNYLGLNHSDERLQEVIEKCSLENLRADVENGKVWTRLVDEKGKSVLYRKGKTTFVVLVEKLRILQSSCMKYTFMVYSHIHSRIQKTYLKETISISGIIGDWKTHFTVAQNEMFEAAVHQTLKNSIFSYKSWN